MEGEDEFGRVRVKRRSRSWSSDRSPHRGRRRSRSTSSEHRNTRRSRRRRRTLRAEQPPATSFARARARLRSGDIDVNGKPLRCELPPKVEEHIKPQLDEPLPPGIVSDPPFRPPEPQLTREEATAKAIADAEDTLANVDTLLAELYAVPDFAAYASKFSPPVHAALSSFAF